MQRRRDTRNHEILYLALAVLLRAKIGKLSSLYFYLTISLFGHLLSWFVRCKPPVCVQKHSTDLTYPKVLQSSSGDGQHMFTYVCSCFVKVLRIWYVEHESTVSAAQTSQQIAY